MSLRIGANIFMKMRKKVGLSNFASRRRVLVGLGIQSEADLGIYQGVVDFFSAGGSFEVIPIGVDFERQVAQLVSGGGVHGVIGEFAGGGWLEELQRRQIPVVHIRQNFTLGDLPSVGIDYRAAGRMGGLYLTECGVERILWVGSDATLVAREILSGLTNAFNGEVRRMSPDAFADNPRVGRGCCLCFAEPRLSIELVGALRRHRLTIPRDVALLSFGRSGQASLWAGVDLSAIPFPWRKVGRTAAAKLAQFLATPPRNAPKKGSVPMPGNSVGGGDFVHKCIVGSEICYTDGGSGGLPAALPADPGMGTGPFEEAGRGLAAGADKGTVPMPEAGGAVANVAGGVKGTGPFLGVGGGCDWVEPEEVYRGGTVEREDGVRVVVRRAVALVEERMEEGLRVGEVARLLGVSRRKLEMAFRSCGMRSPHVEFEELRIERAKRLLCATSLGVGEIGGRCGYSSIHAFSAAFRRVVGTAPRRVRDLHLQKGDEVS